MMKRIQLEPWTAFDKHCLTSAVSRVGDQNWTAVSRATRNIYEDSSKWQSGGEKRSQEWFSNKQCAAQYEHLLKNVPPRRKKRTERTSDQANATESPAEILQQNCRQEFVEELKKTIAEEQAQYLKLLKEYEDILAGRLDHRLEEMQEEYEAKEREKEIKIKLKFKLGEKSLSETPPGGEIERPPLPPPPADPPTTPVKSEKEVGHEPHKTSVTTSPLLTSLLQSPSPLTRPSSVTPTISLILNSSPSVPLNESPTLSKLLENSCPTLTPSTPQQLSAASGGSSSISSLPSISTPQPPRPQAPSTPLSALIEPSSTSSPLRTSTTQAVAAPAQMAPVVQKVEPPVQPPSVTIPPKPEELETNKEMEKESEPVIEEMVQSVTASESTDEETLAIPLDTANDNKKKGLPRRLDLENLEPEKDDNTEFQVMETVEEMIEKVQTAIIETVGDGSGGEGSIQDVRDLSTVAGSETTTVDDQSLDMDLTSDAVDLIVMGPDRPPCIEVNRVPDSVKDDESKGDNIEEVLDIDEIQPSISASDVAELEEPLKNGISGGKDALEEKLSPQAASIEQAEADLAAIALEEEEEAASESAEIMDEKLIDKEAVVIVRRVEEDELLAKLASLEEKEEEPTVEETPEEIVEEAEQKEVEEKEESLEPEKEENEEKAVASRDEDSVVEVKATEESEEDKSVSESQTKEVVSVDEDDSTQDRDSTVSARPMADVEEVTTGTENTSDSGGEKVEDEAGGEKVEDETEQEEQDEPEASKDIEKEETTILSVPEVSEEPDEKPKPKSVEKPSAKEEKNYGDLEDKVEEVRTGKRELRRGRNTPPVTSSPAATPVSDRSLREKRPLTPSSSSDGREEPTPRAGKRKRTTNLSESSVPCSPSPSTVSNDDDKDYRVWKKSILLVYDRIAAHKYASVFLKPINENDAPGYFQIIKCPTDLTTIKRQIENGIIRNTVDFQREMILMISNAIIYNKSDTLVHKMANEMLPDMKEAMETMVQALGSGVLLDQVDSRPPVTARVSRASVSAKGQGGDDSSSTPSGSGQASGKRKRQQPSDDTRSKRKRSDAS